eukprot:CAMPEP_0185829454 /NCGR_PEP_ID=MMETSP1353-20130828/263_1 /TAXON_ID=1077150 /ORGANISM="Erythrolobus australicus, Strain CCMP3124" /LENGTH=135 /DNA_ID=CAMNT_0028527253 /DNA_START=41 /DNA_END=448 /DNA_ORIENTATION=+
MSFLRSISSKVSAYSGASPPSSAPQARPADDNSVRGCMPELALSPAMVAVRGHNSDGRKALASPAELQPGMAKGGPSEPIRCGGKIAEGAAPGEHLVARSAPPSDGSDDFGGARSKSIKRAADATMMYRDLWLQP